MIRVVLDANILVSALLQPQGVPARTFLISLAGTTAQLCISGDIYAEYEEVIRRAKFNRTPHRGGNRSRTPRYPAKWILGQTF